MLNDGFRDYLPSQNRGIKLAVIWFLKADIILLYYLMQPCILPTILAIKTDAGMFRAILLPNPKWRKINRDGFISWHMQLSRIFTDKGCGFKKQEFYPFTLVKWYRIYRELVWGQVLYRENFGIRECDLRTMTGWRLYPFLIDVTHIL